MNDLKYKLSLDNSDYVRKMKSSREEVGKLGKAGGSTNMLPGAGRTSNQLSQLTGQSGRLGSALGRMGSLGSGATGAIGAGFASVAAPVVLFTGALKAAQAVLQAVAEQDSLTRALRGIEGTAAATTARLEELREVARNPGIGFEEAIAGDVRLRAAGISADLSKRSVEQFGNALAAAGKGKAELDGVFLALTQIASKGKVSAEEINQIAERLPQIRSAMQGAFGTADTETIQKMGISSTQFIEGIVAQLGNLPRATGGAQNALDNYQDSWKALKVEVLDFGTVISQDFVNATSGALEGARRDVASLKRALGFTPAALRGEDDTSAKMAELQAKKEELNIQREIIAAKGLNPEGKILTSPQVAALMKEVELLDAKAAVEEKNRQSNLAADEKMAAIKKRRAEEQARTDESLIERAKAASEATFASRLSEEKNLARQIANLKASGPSGQAAVDSQQDLQTKTEILERTSEIMQLEDRLKEINKDKADSAAQAAETAAKEVATKSRAAADFAAETAILDARLAGNTELAETLERQSRAEQLKLRIMREQGIAAPQAGIMAEKRLKLEEGLGKQKDKSKRGGLAGAEESARNRFNRLSKGDKKKAGDFEGFLENNQADRLAVQAERRRKANDAGNAAMGIPAKDKGKVEADLGKDALRIQTKILEKLDKIGAATI